MNDFSSFLFARPTFLEGAGRVLDIGNSFSEFNGSPTPELADLMAIRADWNAVGADIEAVLVEARSVEKLSQK